MTLRTRLFLTSLVIAVPLAVALFVINERMRLGAMEEELRASVDFDLSSGLRERCEMDPPRAGRPGRGNGPPAPAPPPPPPGLRVFRVHRRRPPGRAGFTAPACEQRPTRRIDVLGS